MDGSYQCDCNPDVLGKGYVLYDQPGAQSFPLATGETGLLVGDVRYINHTCVRKYSGVRVSLVSFLLGQLFPSLLTLFRLIGSKYISYTINCEV